jgi:hypothetical protein
VLGHRVSREPVDPLPECVDRRVAVQQLIGKRDELMDLLAVDREDEVPSRREVSIQRRVRHSGPLRDGVQRRVPRLGEGVERRDEDRLAVLCRIRSLRLTS